MKSKNSENTKKDEFELLTRKILRFLEKDFEFKVVTIERYKRGAIYITYKNKTTAVKIFLEPSDGGIFVRLLRLIEGNLPIDPVYLTDKSHLNDFYLDDIVTLVAPSYKTLHPNLTELFKCPVMKKVLVQKAYCLKEFAIGILKGDFTLFPELEKIVKKRAEEYKKLGR